MACVQVELPGQKRKAGAFLFAMAKAAQIETGRGLMMTPARFHAQAKKAWAPMVAT